MLDYDYAGPNPRHDPTRKRGGNHPWRNFAYRGSEESVVLVQILYIYVKKSRKIFINNLSRT